jgi:hypothetical protein
MVLNRSVSTILIVQLRKFAETTKTFVMEPDHCAAATENGLTTTPKQSRKLISSVKHHPNHHRTVLIFENNQQNCGTPNDKEKNWMVERQ